jgi:hypothetical protein
MSSQQADVTLLSLWQCNKDSFICSFCICRSDLWSAFSVETVFQLDLHLWLHRITRVGRDYIMDLL